MVSAEKLVKKFGRLYSEGLGIKLEKGEKEVFKWFLASILFGKRIGENIAMNTYREFAKYGLTTPQKILDAGWDRLVEVLDAGGYVRYDFSTADRLLEISSGLKKRYGTLGNLHREAKGGRDLESRLAEFRGVGPVTVNIFLREMRTIWKKADPEPSGIVKEGARKLGIDLEKFRRKSRGFVRLECALVRARKLIKKGELKL